MRIDLYTKTILTLIVLLLAVVALKPIIQPASVMAQGGITAGLVFIGNSSGFVLLDSRSGETWNYMIGGHGF